MPSEWVGGTAMSSVRTEDIAKRLDDLLRMLEARDMDRPPMEVTLRTLLRYVGQHGSTCYAAKRLAAAFDNILESGDLTLGGRRDEDCIR